MPEQERRHELSIEDIVAVIHEARRDPNSHRVVALRLAVEEIDREAQARRDHVEVSQAVSGGADWVAVGNNHVEYDELQERRAEPRQPPRPAPHPQLKEAFDRAEEEQVVRQEAWRRDDEAAQSADAQEATR